MVFKAKNRIDKMSTIYVQYINGNLKISINIKVNHYSLKRSYRRKSTNNEDNFDKRKCFGVREMFWGAFHASRIEKELKINSKPRFENELELPLARLCSKLTHNLSLLTGWTGRNLTRTIFFRAWIRSIRLSLSAVVIINFLNAILSGEYLNFTVLQTVNCKLGLNYSR